MEMPLLDWVALFCFVKRRESKLIDWRNPPVLLALSMAGLVVLCGCRKPAEQGGTDSPRAADVSGQIAKMGPDSPEVLTELTEAVHRYWEHKGHRPQGLDEVVAAGYLKKIGILPDGQCYEIDQKTGQVYLSDQPSAK